MKQYNIAQIGTFDVENYGDLLFPVVLECELKKRIEIQEISLFSPVGGEVPFTKRKVYPLQLLEEKIKKQQIDAIIVGGGDLIRLDKSISPTYRDSYLPAVDLWQTPILLAKKYHIPILYNALGVPFVFLKEQKVVIDKLLENVDYLSVRDQSSKKILSCDCAVVPDTINIISKVYSKKDLQENLKKLQKENIAPKLNEYMIFQHKKIFVEDNSYIENLKAFLRYLTKTEKRKILILPIGYVHDDIDFLKTLIDEKDSSLFVIKEKLSPYDMLSVIACSSGFIGTSLHGLITANAYNVPIMAMNKEHLVKITGFLQLADKTELEINDSEDATEIYQEYFWNQSFSSNKKMIAIIEEHFDKMVEIIKDKKVSDSINLESMLLENLYSNIEKYKLLDYSYQQTNQELQKRTELLDNIFSSKRWKYFQFLNRIVKKNKDNKKLIIIKEESKVLTKTKKKIAIQIHVFYPTLLKEIYQNLMKMPYSFDCYISTDTVDKKKKIEEFFQSNSVSFNVYVEVFENRGRDIMPFLEQMRPVIRNYDYICHLHTKKSKHSTYGSKWRRYLYYNLLGTKKNIQAIFQLFHKNRNVGIIFPPTFKDVVPLMGIHENRENLEKLFEKFDIDKEYLKEDIMFAAGSMFWAKTDAILPVFDCIHKNEFPKEAKQEDGTMAHAVERLFVVLAKSRNYDFLQTLNETKNENKQ